MRRIEKESVSTRGGISEVTKFSDGAGVKAWGQHRWELLVLYYHKIMVIYPYPFLVLITLLFS